MVIAKLKIENYSNFRIAVRVVKNITLDKSKIVSLRNLKLIFKNLVLIKPTTKRLGKHNICKQCDARNENIKDLKVIILKDYYSINLKLKNSK